MSLILSRVVCLSWSLCCSFLGTETLRSLLPDTKAVTFFTKYQVCSPPGILTDWCRLFLWCHVLFPIIYQRLQRLCKFSFRIGWPQFVPECLHLFGFGNDNPLHLCSFLRLRFHRILTVSLDRFASKAAPSSQILLAESNKLCKSVCVFDSWLMHFSKFLELSGVELSIPWKTSICSENRI